MNEAYKEVYFVYFNQYCHTCIHCDKPGCEDPCDECLGEPVNVYSHKPTKYVEKENKK